MNCRINARWMLQIMRNSEIASLRTADAFPVVASLPPKNSVCDLELQNDVTSFLFLFTRPMKLSDRKMLLKRRGKSRGPTTASEVALCTHEWGNAEKSYLGRRRLFFV